MGCIRTYLSIYLFSKERKEEKRKLVISIIWELGGTLVCTYTYMGTYVFLPGSVAERRNRHTAFASAAVVHLGLIIIIIITAAAT